MKKGYLILIAFLLALHVQAQDSSIVQAGYDCDAAAFTYGDAIIRHYSSYNDDSLQIVMEEWERLCGNSEPLLSFKIIYAIERGTFTEDMYGDNIARYLLAYQSYWTGNTTGEIPPNVPIDYYPYLQSIAKGLKALELTPLERTLAEFYTNHEEDVLERMDTTLASTKLYKSYAGYKEEQYKLFGRFHLGVLAGVWVPEGNIAALGSHPLIGLQIGSMWQKLSFDVNLSFRFINTPNDIRVFHLGAMYDTRYHGAVFVGLDAGYNFATFNKHRLNLLGGIGYDAITVLKATSEEASDGKFISSVNLNGGMGYRYYFGKKQYIGLIGKYNLLFFKNPGGTDLSGNAITLALVYGFH